MKKTWLTACVLACAGTGALHVYLARFEHERAGGTPRGVVMVTRDVMVGDLLADADLALKEVPERFVEERQVLATDRDTLVGARSTAALTAGAAVLWTDVDAAPQGRTLASLVRSGMRAVTLKTSEAGFEGLLRAGDRVDVLSTATHADQGRETITLLQNALVLSVGEDLGAGAPDNKRKTSARQVAISVTPADAQLIAHARGRGPLSLSLRNPGDIAAVSLGSQVRDVALGNLAEAAPKDARHAR